MVITTPAFSMSIPARRAFKRAVLDAAIRNTLSSQQAKVCRTTPGAGQAASSRGREAGRCLAIATTIGKVASTARITKG